MSLIDIIKALSTVLSSAINKSLLHKREKLLGAENLTRGCCVRSKSTNSVLSSPLLYPRFLLVNNHYQSSFSPFYYKMLTLNSQVRKKKIGSCWNRTQDLSVLFSMSFSASKIVLASKGFDIDLMFILVARHSSLNLFIKLSGC